MTSATVARSLKTGMITLSVRYLARGGASVMSVSGHSAVTFRAKYSIVRPIPSRSPIVGSQPNSLPGQGDIGAAAGRVIGRQRFEDDVRRRAGELQDEVGQLQHGALVRVPNVDRADERRVEKGDEAR